MMLGGLLDAVEIVVVHPLAIVVFTTGDDIAHIAALHGSVAIFVHQLIGSLQMALVVAGRGRCLMMHLQADALGMGIVVQALQVEVGIRRLEVKNVVFRLAKPIFPANVPTLYKHLVETMLGSKVDITPYIVIVGTMKSVRLGL